MPIKFVLPQNAFTGICSFLDVTSLFQLREVSKTSMELAEATILNTRTTEIIHFIFNRNSGQKINFNVDLRTRRDYLIWKMAFRSVKRKIYTMNFRSSCVIHDLSVSVYSEDAIECFKYLKTIIHHSDIQELNFIDCSPNTPHMFLNIFKDKLIPKVVLSSNEINLVSFPGFLQKVNANSFTCSSKSLRKDFIAYLLKVADTVKELVVWGFDCEPKVDIANFARQVFKRKCERFEFNVRNNSASTADAEKLIEHLHHLDKKVSFKTFTRAVPINAQIGSYAVRDTRSSHMRQLEFKHVDLI